MEAQQGIRFDCQRLLVNTRQYDIQFLMYCSFAVIVSEYSMKSLVSSIQTQEFVLQNENLTISSKAAVNFKRLNEQDYGNNK